MTAYFVVQMGGTIRVFLLFDVVFPSVPEGLAGLEQQLPSSGKDKSIKDLSKGESSRDL